MAKIYSLKIKNFRGIQNFEHFFYGNSLICIIGRGDSGKSTLLEAIAYVLSPNWNLAFYDTDFYKCNTDNPIEIEVTLIDLPERLIREDKYGLYIRCVDVNTNEIIDDFEKIEDNNCHIGLTIKLEVKQDLEPNWYVISGRELEAIKINAKDRSEFNVFMISDYVDRHFSWSKGTPLYSLLRQQNQSDYLADNDIIVDALREAKYKIDSISFEKFQSITNNIKSKIIELGIDLSEIDTSIDFKDIIIRENKLSLHEGKIPFRLRGKGSKRLISMAIQLLLAEKGGIILIDEIEQGLEPDRVQQLVNILKKYTQSQIFITTHSRDVVVELGVKNLFMMRKNNSKLIELDQSLQGCVRKNPEAFFARKVIICEGATEIGICKALNEFRVEKGKKNIACLGIRIVDGTGSKMLDYCKGFKKIDYDVLLFCDSDKNDINKKKTRLKSIGIMICDCKSENAIEEQIFQDLPWEGIIELVNYVNKYKVENHVKDSLKSKLKDDYSSEWMSEENFKFRKALGEIAKKKEWFKRIDHGKFLGSVIFKYIKHLQDTPLGIQMTNILKWIEDD